MRDKEIDLLIVSSPENVFYLTGAPTSFTASNRILFCVKRYSPVFCVVPSDGEPILILSASAFEVCQKYSWIKDLRLYETGTYVKRPKPLQTLGKEPDDVLVSATKGQFQSTHKRNPKVGIEFNDLGVRDYQFLIKAIDNVNIFDATPLLMESRMIKNDEEIRRFEKATDILCKVMHEIEDACTDKPRPTELDLDILLKSELLKEGAQSWQQTTIAAGKVGGPDICNQPVPNRRIKNGDVIRLDIGCVYEGYCADLSRTFAVETIPSYAKKAYEVIRMAYDLYLSELKPGTPASRINKLAVDYVRKNLDKNYQRGYVGHGVGVEVYDRPFLSENDHTPLEKGMTLSYEIPYHIFGRCGLNLEDSVLITDHGNRLISDYDRDIIVV
jgi:Xaa-Pro aminopeptidase